MESTEDPKTTDPGIASSSEDSLVPIISATTSAVVAVILILLTVFALTCFYVKRVNKQRKAALRMAHFSA